MPVTPTYPGVYVEEIPSGVRTIVGVATSITAFVGRTRNGEINDPITCNSFADFERKFGGLHQDYPLSYAVRDFFLNGGSNAIIVRLTAAQVLDSSSSGANVSADNQKEYDAAKSVSDAVQGAADLAAAKTAAKAANDAIQGDANQSAEAKAAAQKVFDAVNAVNTNLADAKTAATNALPQRYASPKSAVLRLPSTVQDAIDAAKSVSDAVQGAADLAAAKTAAKAANDAIQGDASKSAEVKAAAQKVFDAVDAVNTNLADAKKAATDALPTGQTLQLQAVSPGSWGDSLRARIDYDGVNLVGTRYAPLTPDKLFNLTIEDTTSGMAERFINLAVKDGVRSIDRVLQNQSQLVRVAAAETLPDVRPLETDSTITAQEKTQHPTWKRIAPFSADDIQYSLRTEGVAQADEGTEGGKLTVNEYSRGPGLQDAKQGIYALEKVDLFNVLCIPPDQRDESLPKEVYQDALAYCAQRRSMLIVDPPVEWDSADKITANNNQAITDLGLNGNAARNAVLYFPRVIESDSRRENQPYTFSSCGIIAGIWARTDVARGVWKAPAGLEAGVMGIQKLAVNLNDAENGMLNPLGINCLRTFPVIGTVVWGARTLRGADQLTDEYKYVPVRRLALYIEESLYRGLKWVVFEPNDEPLWSQIRLNVGAFMHDLFRKGAFQGTNPRDAYFVRCDSTTTTQSDINLGIVNVVVGFAPLKPAEFVIIQLQQMAGQIQV